MSITVSQIRDELADREAIKDCLYRYSRGVDRLDEDMVRSAYWPDAIDNHLEFKGNVEEFIAWGFPLMRSMDQTMHIIANIMIRLKADKANVESYFYGIHRMNFPDGPRDVIGAGRYLDRFERRNGEWRIANRIVMTDWFREYPDSADWTIGPFGMRDVATGARYPDDKSYTWLGLR